MSLHILTNVKLIYRPFYKRLIISTLRNIGNRNEPILTVKEAKFSSKSKRYAGWSIWRNIFKGFVPIGVCLIAVMQWRAYRKNLKEKSANNVEINFYRILPLRIVSRCWGWIADRNIPEPIRPIVYGLYTNAFGVDISEAMTEDFKSYRSLSDFFARSLRDGVRTVDESSCLVSPCDGTVLHYDVVDSGHVEQVKGVTYSLEQFLGENTWNKNGRSVCDYRTSLLHKLDKSNTLYQCVIYLAPGDYHRFHSPADWNPTHRRHFHGELLSVSPRMAQCVPGLFCLNERAVYLGHWKYGFFSFTAVGATNVGSVKVYFDKTLQTNRPKLGHKLNDKCLGTNVILRKGDPVGEFRMGSTIILVFEAPSQFQFNIKAGQKIKMGQSIGCAVQQTHTSTTD